MPVRIGRWGFGDICRVTSTYLELNVMIILAANW